MDIRDIDVKTRLDLLDLPQKAMEAVIWRDADLYAGCFTVDAVWDPRPLVPHCIEGGREEIRKAFLQFYEQLKWAAQGLYFTRIAAFDGQRATLRSYLGEYAQAKDGSAPVGFGMYTDKCIIEDGEWRMAHHGLTPIYFGSADYANPIFQQLPRRGSMPF
jgi:SnoaL-like domain